MLQNLFFYWYFQEKFNDFNDIVLFRFDISIIWLTGDNHYFKVIPIFIATFFVLIWLYMSNTQRPMKSP
jgi:hypothetical protein